MRSILVVMAAVAIGFAVAIWFGFWIHTKATAIPDNVFGVAAYVAIFVIALLLTCAGLRISPFSGWTVREMFGPQQGKRIYVRPAERAPARGQAAYLADPNGTATCTHLQPIERAMRAAGVEVRLLEVSAYAPVIAARCRIDEDELRRVFQLPPSVYYREADDPRADIVCGYCVKTDRTRADILVLHPRECSGDARWFPGPVSGGGEGRSGTCPTRRVS
jgi:hypothetical protein